MVDVIDITHIIFKGRDHRDLSFNSVKYTGVNELGDEFIENIFKDTCIIRKLDETQKI